MINFTPLEGFYGHLGLVVLVIPEFRGSCVERWYFLSLCMVSLYLGVSLFLLWSSCMFGSEDKCF